MEVFSYTIGKVAVKYSGPEFFKRKFRLQKVKDTYYWECIGGGSIGGRDLLLNINKLDGYFIDRHPPFDKFKFLKKHLDVACKDLKALPKRLK